MLWNKTHSTTKNLRPLNEEQHFSCRTQRHTNNCSSVIFFCFIVMLLPILWCRCRCCSSFDVDSTMVIACKQRLCIQIHCEMYHKRSSLSILSHHRIVKSSICVFQQLHCMQRKWHFVNSQPYDRVSTLHHKQSNNEMVKWTFLLSAFCFLFECFEMFFAAFVVIGQTISKRFKRLHNLLLSLKARLTF